MTNRNRNMKNKSLRKKHENEKHVDRKEEKRLDARIVIDIIPIIISCFALVVSGITLCVNYYFNNKEYEYKLDPEVEVAGGFGVQVVQDENQRKAEPFIENLHIEILQKNNLMEAYMIHPDNTVDKLKIDNIEEVLASELNNSLKMNRKDLVFDDIFYQYEFLYLKGLDGTSELYLVYTKSNGDFFNFNGVSGIEIWGLANSHPDDPDFEGEKMMAAQYEQIIKDSEKYIF